MLLPAPTLFKPSALTHSSHPRFQIIFAAKHFSQPSISSQTICSYPKGPSPTFMTKHESSLQPALKVMQFLLPVLLQNKTCILGLWVMKIMYLCHCILIKNKKSRDRKIYLTSFAFVLKGFILILPIFSQSLLPSPNKMLREGKVEAFSLSTSPTAPSTSWFTMSTGGIIYVSPC